VGIGDGTAGKWYAAGYTSVDQVKQAVEQHKLAADDGDTLPAVDIPHVHNMRALGGVAGAGAAASTSTLTIRSAMRFGLQYHDEMKGGATCTEIEDMRRYLQDVLETEFGGGWTMEICGGTRRAGGVQVVRDAAEKSSKSASSDADFLLTRFGGYPTEPVLSKLVEVLLQRCKLDRRWLMQSEGQCNMENIRNNANEVERGRWVMLCVLVKEDERCVPMTNAA
jgi:hypothetical protein